MTRLTVDEAAATYERAMRNVLPAGPGVCSTCKTFIDPQHGQCYPCAMEVAFLDVVVPITYSEHLGQMHHALRGYKDGLPAERAYAMPRIAAILWKFLARHEACVARAIGCEGFEVVTTVPSSSVARDERSPLRTIAEWCNPISDRLDRLLRPTDKVAGRSFSVERFEATRALEGENVLLLDRHVDARRTRGLGRLHAAAGRRGKHRPRRGRAPSAARVGGHAGADVLGHLQGAPEALRLGHVLRARGLRHRSSHRFERT